MKNLEDRELPADRAVRRGAAAAAGAFFLAGGLAAFAVFLGLWLPGAFHAGPGGVAAVYVLVGLGAAAGAVVAARGDGAPGRPPFGASLATALAMLALASFAWGPGLFACAVVLGLCAALCAVPPVAALVAAAGRAADAALAASAVGVAVWLALGAAARARGGMIAAAAVCALGVLLAWAAGRLSAPGRAAGGQRRTLGRRAARGLAAAAVALLLVVALVLPWALSVLVTKARTRPDERDRPETPATYGAPFEDVTFASSDGNTLSGWYLPAAGSDLTLVMSHGLFRSRYELLERGVDLWKLGYGVLLYDLRRHGRSDAEFATLGYEERHDVEAALAFARSRAPGGRVALFGVSMGAAATLLAAAESEGVAAVVADSSFLSLRHTVYHHVGLLRLPTYPFAPVLLWVTAARLGYAPSKFDVLAAARSVRVPVLFIGGTADVRMPVDTVLAPLYDAAPSPLKRRYVVEGAPHGHAYDQDRAAYVAAVDDFLRSVR